MFLNRGRELALLQRWWEADASELVTVYGRRQVGKTELLVRFLNDKPTIYFYADRQLLPDQLRGFTEQERQDGRIELISALAAKKPGSVEQLQCFAVPGHKADFGVMMAGPDLKAMHGTQMAMQGSTLGPAPRPMGSIGAATSGPG